MTQQPRELICDRCGHIFFMTKNCTCEKSINIEGGGGILLRIYATQKTTLVSKWLCWDCQADLLSNIANHPKTNQGKKWNPQP